MFGGDPEEDDISLFPAPSTNLASLFGQTMAAPNVSLTYTAPKQPSTKPEEPPKPQKKASSVILFKQVIALEPTPNGRQQNMCGLALIGNETTKQYHLLIYKQKNNILSTSTITQNFQYVIHSEKRVSFVDNAKIKWSILFTNETDSKEFASVIKSCNGTISIEEDTTNVKLSSDTEKQKYVQVKREPHIVDSDIHSDSSGTATRADILSRMAKMGQKLLPNAHKPTQTDSDSDDIAQPNAKPRKPKRSPSSPKDPVKVAANPPVIVSNPYVPISQPVMLSGTMALANVNKVAENTSQIMYSAPMYTNEQMNVFFAENRTHNSELRMSMMRLMTKVEEMSDKLGQGKTETAEYEVLKTLHREDASKISELEAKCLELTSKIMNLSETIKNHESSLMEQRKRIDDLQSEVADRNTEILELKSEKSQSDAASSQMEVSLKKSMNYLYHSIISDIKDDESYTGKDIKKILASRIIEQTSSVLNIVRTNNSGNTI